MKRVAAPLGVFLILMAVYIWTMAPGNFWIDSAAFTACNEILGLPHSPSFPLYTVLGRAVHVLAPVEPAMASNLYSALAAASGGVVFYLILGLLLAPSSISTGVKRMAPITGALCAFLAVPIWQSAVRAEVYSLQTLLSLLVVFLFLKAVRCQLSHHRIRFALAAVFCQGLSFANHSLLAVTTLPLIISLPFFMEWPAIKSNILKLAAVTVLIFCVAISFYLYLPIRSQQNPAINSGQPKTTEATLKAITRSGEDYLPVSPPVEVNYLSRTGRLAGFVYDQTGGLILLGVITGIFITLRQRNMIMLLFSAMIPIGLALTVWAADFKMLNFDIVAYSALPLILLIMISFYGLSHLAGRVSDRVRIDRIISVVFSLLAIFQFTGNLYACDLSGTKGPDKLAGNILRKAPANSILLLNEDNVVLPLWFHRYALDKRPDLAVISAGALYRPSYRNELRVLHPELQYPDEFKPYRIENLDQAISSFCELNGNNHPIMIQFGVPGIDADEITPNGFLFQYGLTIGDSKHTVDYPTLAMLEDLARGATDLLTKDFVARNAFNFGVYFDRIGQGTTAYQFFQYAIEIDDENPGYLLHLGLAFLKAGKRDEAIMLLQEAVKTGEGCPEAEALLKRINDREYGKL
jgi:hypothetical protein